MAPTAAVDTSSDDDDATTTALAVGLGVPLAILSLFCLIYFAWYQNSCGVFESESNMKVPLMETDGDGELSIAKDSASNSNV